MEMNLLSKVRKSLCVQIKIDVYNEVSTVIVEHVLCFHIYRKTLKLRLPNDFVVTQRAFMRT